MGISRKEERRLRGVYYTPRALAEWMVRRTLARVEGYPGKLPTILDPACGAGVFLLAAQREIQNALRVSGVSIGESIERSLNVLFGVDLDGEALNQFQESCQVQISEQGGVSSSEIPASGIREGNAVTGEGWGTSLSEGLSPSDGVGSDHSGVNWKSAFPEVCARGGFDVVIANPPYLREKDAREEFARIAESAWGKVWREARMDLWHYFLHRSLDLVRPGGIVCMVVNSYWMHASGSRKLIQRLCDESTMLEMVDFSTYPLFEGVQGRHMVFWLRKGNPESGVLCQIHRLQEECFVRSRGVELEKILEDEGEGGYWQRSELLQSEVVNGGELHFEGDLESTISGEPLDRVCVVRQGVAENPPVVSRKHVMQYPEEGWEVGRGVFVLTGAEVEELGLSVEEKALLRPYWETRELDRYSPPRVTTRSILYLTPRTTAEVEGLPRIGRHLERYRILLERRREVQRGVISWWHLHWPREEWLFRGERIVSLQMGSRPRFVYCDQPGVVGFSCHVLHQREEAGWSLPAITGILNSARAEKWFERKGKSRGKKLDIGGGVLKLYPLPVFQAVADQELERLVLERQGLDGEGDCCLEVENEIEEWVARCYDSGGAGVM